MGRRVSERRSEAPIACSEARPLAYARPLPLTHLHELAAHGGGGGDRLLLEALALGLRSVDELEGGGLGHHLAVDDALLARHVEGDADDGDAGADAEGDADL